MSTYWSLYLVPDHWSLMDCIAVGYMHKCMFMLRDDEVKTFIEKQKHQWTELYDEIIQQPCIHDYTTDSGDPDFERICQVMPAVGRLYEFHEDAYKLIPELASFCNEHRGKRYMCLN